MPKQLRMNQAALVRLSGLSDLTIRRIEQARATEFRHDTLQAIERALGWSDGSAFAVMAGGQPHTVETMAEEAYRALMNRAYLLQFDTSAELVSDYLASKNSFRALMEWAERTGAQPEVYEDPLFKMADQVVAGRRGTFDPEDITLGHEALEAESDRELLVRLTRDVHVIRHRLGQVDALQAAVTRLAGIVRDLADRALAPDDVDEQLPDESRTAQ